MSLVKTVLSKLFETALDKEEKETPDSGPPTEKKRFRKFYRIRLHCSCRSDIP